VPDHRSELVLREKTLELSGEEDSWSPPSRSKGGIRQAIDHANALEGLTRSLRCSLEHAPALRADSPKASEHVLELSGRSNPIQSCVDQSREQQQMKSFVDGRQQRLESNHAQPEEVIPIRSERTNS